MASSFPLIEDISDKHCEMSCNLEYGISEVFNQNVIHQQNVKASKSHLKPQIFNDPIEQAKFTCFLFLNINHYLMGKERAGKIFRVPGSDLYLLPNTDM